MAVCAAYRIRHSEFLSWPDDDRDKALWWEIHQRQTCPECGTRPVEWDPDQGGHDYAYLAELHQCWGCSTRAHAQQGITDDMGQGVGVVLVRNPAAGPPPA